MKRIGILGTGNIAGVMARTIRKMPQACCYAVASRTRVKAEAFAVEYGFRKAYGSYEELARDSDIDLIYIATPHSEHYDNAMLCISEGRPVLCEKAFTANAAQAETLLRFAEKKGVFITEAMWTRYMPFRDTIRETLDSGVIGRPWLLTANLGYRIDQVKRLRDPALAGGALLDVGIYPLNFAAMMFDEPIAKMTSSCTYTDTGVDEQDGIILTYEDGKIAVLNCSMMAVSDRRGVIYGTDGFLVVDNCNSFESLNVYNAKHELTATYRCPPFISGYEYEVQDSLAAIEQGRTESQRMPHAETLRLMRLMDQLRKEWGVRYPFE